MGVIFDQDCVVVGFFHLALGVFGGFVVGFEPPSLGHIQKYSLRQFIYGHPYPLYMVLVMTKAMGHGDHNGLQMAAAMAAGKPAMVHYGHICGHILTYMIIYGQKWTYMTIYVAMYAKI